MKKFTRLLALFLVFALCVQMLPVNVLAEELSADDLDNIEEAEEGRPGTTVLGELSDRRAENEKHFRMDDGSYIAVDYGMPVHYTEDEGTTWEDIDNTLSLSNSAGNSQMKSIRRQNTESVYSTTNGDTSKSFAYDLRSGFLFSTQTGSHTLRMSLANEFSNRDQADLSIRSMAINSAG